jgi:hypothetical protein
MLRHLFGRDGGGHRPYRDDAANGMYNLLFCDEPARFAPKGEAPQGVLATVLAESSDRAALESIANDEGMESRIRMLAFNRLRAMNVAVPSKQLLGVILEVPLGRGLDTLAVFADGRMRYINQAEKIGIFEDAPPAIAQKVQMVLRASQAVVDQIGPATEPRRAPPTADLTRMTFLVSDGLYFGEAASDDMYTDRLGGPVMGNAAELLSLLVDYTLQRQAGQSGKSN